MATKKDTDDSDLFRAVMQDVTPLKRNSPRLPPSSPIPQKTLAPKHAKAKKQKVCPAAYAGKPPKPNTKQSALQHGDITDLDRRKGQRFKRGQLPIEGRLDLHGMTQNEAFGALGAFIARQFAMGRRCVIVVTGKGVSKEGGGVLRNAVPRWLNETTNRDKVLAFEYARQRDGGAGALYVLLKRKRSG